MVSLAPADVQVGDVIEVPNGVEQCDVITVHGVHRYDTGALSIRYSYTGNPRGIDWSCFIEHDETQLRLLSRGVAAIHTTIRSMLP